MNSKQIALYAGREVLGLVVMGAALFWSAGRFDWWPAWAALAVMATWTAAMAVLIVLSPDRLAERLGPRKGAKRWDIAIVRIVGDVTFVRYIVAGLDQRYGWTGEFPVAAQVAALAICHGRQSLLLANRPPTARAGSIGRRRWTLQLPASSRLPGSDPIRVGRAHPSRLLVVSAGQRRGGGSACPAHGSGRPNLAGRAGRLCRLCASGALPPAAGNLVVKCPSRCQSARQAVGEGD
jgi:hypothetical protein